MFESFSSDMRTPSIASGILHAGIVIIALVGLPFFDRAPPPEPEPMIVDYEEIGPKAGSPKVEPIQPVSRAPIAEKIVAAPPPTSAEKPPSEQARQPEPPRPEKPVPPKTADPAPVKPPEPEKARPDPDIALKPQQPEPPVKEPPKPAPTQAQEPKKEPPKPEPPKPVQQAARPQPPPAPPKPPEKTVDQILDSVLKNKDPTPQPHKPVQEAAKPAQPTRTPTTAPNFAQRLTTTEMAAMADRVRPCWNVNPDAMDARTMVVEIIVDMQPDGMVSNARIGDGIAIRGAQHQAFAQAALRAVQNPRCQPLPYPQGKYEALRQFIFRFDPRDL